MGERYSRAEMRQVWTEENKFDAYLKDELVASGGWGEVGVGAKGGIGQTGGECACRLPRS